MGTNTNNEITTAWGVKAKPSKALYVDVSFGCLYIMLLKAVTERKDRFLVRLCSILYVP